MERIQQYTPAIIQQTTEVRQIPALKERRLGRLGKTTEKSFSRIHPPSCAMQNYKVSENVS